MSTQSEKESFKKVKKAYKKTNKLKQIKNNIFSQNRAYKFALFFLTC